MFDCIVLGQNAVKEYIVNARDKIIALKQKFAYFEVVKVTSKEGKEIKSVDRTELKARKREENNINKGKEKKLKSVQATIKRAKVENISINEENGEFYAVSSTKSDNLYKAQLNHYRVSVQRSIKSG